MSIFQMICYYVGFCNNFLIVCRSTFNQRKWGLPLLRVEDCAPASIPWSVRLYVAFGGNIMCEKSWELMYVTFSSSMQEIFCAHQSSNVQTFFHRQSGILLRLYPVEFMWNLFHLSPGRVQRLLCSEHHWSWPKNCWWYPQTWRHCS